ncbi:winged helix-turn-helix transcriptional regulator [Microlunatus soli]|uniref:DNA-binding transcriptional regulator, HxlR family n=1 Tax=Microlunatus soli TaxID=630515 RepID=A0A1H1Y356_9ACTN|nr:helix-turn-helix domain-containing protein [Microlunatus soli]SDT15822.1 DNA-binding transcriptional regulator, HxlR family [Microlunatus soli]
MRRADSSDAIYHCPVEVSLEVLDGKWTPVILAHLKEGVQRYGDLHRRMPQVSEKMLTQRLRDLIADGLVDRHVGDGKPAPVSYRLTEEGRTLTPVLEALYAWGAGRAERFGLTVRQIR